jgi:hypothetical protein
MLLLFGLVAAPLLHRVGHQHDHQHGPLSPAAPHGAGAVEHLDALVHRVAGAAPPSFVAMATAERPLPRPDAAPLLARLAIAQPQGP